MFAAVILWILFGALAGWIIALLTRRADITNTTVNVVTGIVGAVGAGLIFEAAKNSKDSMLAQSLIACLAGAIILTSLTEFFRPSAKH